MRFMQFWLAAVAFAPCAAQADSLRCGDRLVHTDAPAGEVVATCGEPDYRERWITLRDDVAAEEAEAWTYNFGPDRFMRTLYFRRGRLVQIETGGYGYRLAAEPATEIGMGAR